MTRVINSFLVTLPQFKATFWWELQTDKSVDKTKSVNIDVASAGSYHKYILHHSAYSADIISRVIRWQVIKFVAWRRLFACPVELYELKDLNMIVHIYTNRHDE